MSTIYKTALRAIKKSPFLFSALRQVYWERELSKAPTLNPLGIRIRGLPSMEDGSFEQEETKRFLGLLPNIDVFVNVGANVGYYVCLARQASIRTLAIEPLDRNIQQLQLNLRANDWDDVEIHPVAAADRVSLMNLYGGGTSASLVPGWAGTELDHCRTVPVTTLDNILSNRFSGSRLLILIDVEGGELNALRGSTAQLGRTPAPIWFVEVCINEHQPAGTIINPNLMETFELFWEHGYTAETIGSLVQGVTKKDLDQWQRGFDLPKTRNFLFKKQ